MISCLFLLFVISPVLTGVLKEDNVVCGDTELACDGRCVPFSKLCDGIKDCFDGSDEEVCKPGQSSNDLFRSSAHDRTKRQAKRKCHKSKWTCRDGSCINFDGKCDGVVNCPDGSDETYPLCRNMQCQSNWFRCTYGACVDGSAPCNGIKECNDNSDELSPACRNSTDETRGQFKCENGQLISANNRCDGVTDCGDGSDETVRSCANRMCPAYLFQCAYGACVDSGSDCNGKTECADGSDESEELCNRIATPTTGGNTGGTGGTGGTGNQPSGEGKCVLPQHPEHGKYVAAGLPFAAPGQVYDTVYLNVTCSSGYGVDSDSSDVFCLNGMWTKSLPKCVHFCKLPKHPSVEYRCVLTGNNVQGYKECDELVPVGTIVRPECRTPNYYAAGVLNSMRCIDGIWDHVGICKPECGRVSPDGMQLVIGGVSAKFGELPWHAGIYRKTDTPYMQICGGSLVSATAVISAAHCFWSDVEGLLPAQNYAVGVGKIYRPWEESHDLFAQKSDVTDIKVTKRYSGVKSNFQEDIAILILASAIHFETNVRPVCLDFDFNFDSQQLQSGNMGKVAGWGLTSANGGASQVLKVVKMPYIDIRKCIDESPLTFQEYITGDKICAGYLNGTAVCQGDSGGGLVFSTIDHTIERFYLRGIVSTAPNNDDKCNSNAYTTFTQILKHQYFIKDTVLL